MAVGIVNYESEDVRRIMGLRSDRIGATLGYEYEAEVVHRNNLAVLYETQGNYAPAERLYQRSLAIDEKALGPEHPDVATSLNNLAALYKTQGKYVEAEPLFKRAIAIHEKALGPDHPGLATDLNNLAELYYAQGKYAEADTDLETAAMSGAEVSETCQLKAFLEFYRADYEAAVPAFECNFETDQENPYYRMWLYFARLYAGIDDRESLAAYKCPRKVQFVDDVPKTSTGKIMRRELHTLDND